MIQIRLTQASSTSSPEKESGEIDLTNLPAKEFKTKVIHGLAEKYARTKEGEYRNKTISGRTSKQNGRDARDH